MERFVALSLLVCAHVAALTEIDTIAALQETCPYTNFCQKNASRVIQGNHQSPCCMECSCTDECWRRGNCCPDKVIKNKGSPHEQETCAESLVKKSQYDSFFNNGYDNYRRRYFVTKTCPDTENDEFVRAKCNGTLAESFSDLLWVTDTKTNKIYNNRFCAQCHGVRKYRPWNLETGCTKFLISVNHSQNLKAFPEDCSMSVTPPNKKAQESMCILPDISTCNETGLWKHRDRITEKLCESHSLMFVEEGRMHLKSLVYRNVFCFECNSPPGSAVQDTCSYRNVNMKAISSFSAILNIFEEDGALSKARRCAADEVEDPLKKFCLKLICPILSRPWYGSCGRLSSALHLLGISVTYRLQTKWDMVKYGAKKGEEYRITDLAVAIRRQMYEDLQQMPCENLQIEPGKPH